MRLITFALLPLCLATPCFLRAEIVQIDDGDLDGSSGAYYTVPEGSAATVIAVALKGDTARLRIGGAEIPAGALQGTVVVPGGQSVAVDADRSEDGSLALALLRVEPVCTGGDYVPANAVVIPADASGDVRIVLESSVDLVNWLPALPGSYGSSAERRFFRVRAVVEHD